ncbi:unnamed protein product [Cutaneotrichosporon oleaginosum]
MEPLEAIRDASPPPSPRAPRMPPRRASAHVYPPDWLNWMKQSPKTRRFSFRKSSAGQTSSKSNDQGEPDPHAQIDLVPGTPGIPLTTLSPPSSPNSPTSPISPTPPAPSRRHSNAWHFFHSFVSNDGSASSAPPSTNSQAPSSPRSTDSALAMPSISGQGSPVATASALPGEVMVREPPAPAVAESPAPPSAHDEVVNKLLQRPIVHRSNSTPVPPAPAAIGKDIHRTLSGTASPNDARAQSSSESIRDSPLSTMLRGPLDASGGGVTRALGSHIEAVLSAQVEIGRAHLALEGIGAVKPAGLDLVNPPQGEGEEEAQRVADAADADEADLLRRQKGVEELMAKVSMSHPTASGAVAIEGRADNQLSELATSIKSYHAIGTPAHIFPTFPQHATPAKLAGLPRVAIANPAMARNEFLPTSADSLPAPEPRQFPPNQSAATTKLLTPISPAASVARRGVQTWFRKNEGIADSPTELTPVDRDGESMRKRPW